jgi:hypothetical protein
MFAHLFPNLMDLFLSGNVLEDIFQVSRLNKHVWRDKGYVAFTSSLLMPMLEVSIEGYNQGVLH